MSNFIEELQTKKEATQLLICSKQAAKVSTRIAKLFLEVKEVQPKVTYINTGMGTWSFCGKGIGFYNEHGEERECEFDAMELEDYSKNPIGSYCDVPINDALVEIVELLNYLCCCDDDSLNCSTWQTGFDENGIIFTYSEIENKTGNPFSVPTKEYFTDCHYFRLLMKDKCKISWEIDNNKS